jgi:hypothetical protein
VNPAGQTPNILSPDLVKWALQSAQLGGVLFISDWVPTNASEIIPNKKLGLEQVPPFQGLIFNFCTTLHKQTGLILRP